MSQAFWRYARAAAMAGQGNLRESEAERRRFEGEREAMPSEAQYLINNKAADLLALASAALDAHIATAGDQTAAAIDHWRRAIELEAALQYDEPPPWFYPVRQSLGGALLRDGRPQEAEEVFREALAEHPRDGRLLFGLWRSLVEQDKEGAELVEARFESAWRESTVDLSVEEL